MQYKVSKQFAKDVERPAAEFLHKDDAELFIAAKSSDDQSKGLKLIYRLFDRYHLLREYNKEKITTPISRAQYAEGYLDLPHHLDPFRLLDKDETMIARFSDLEDARLFAQTKLIAEENNAYSIFNIKQFVEKIDENPTNLPAEGTQGQGKKTSFKPTPFAMAPRLGPPKWLKDEDEDEGKDNK